MEQRVYTHRDKMKERVQCKSLCVVFVLFLLLIYFCSLPGAAHNGQEINEDVDDVSVEVQSSEDVLFWAQCQLLVA